MFFSSRLIRARPFSALRPFTGRYAWRASVSDSPSTPAAARLKSSIIRASDLISNWEMNQQVKKGDGWRDELNDSEKNRLALIETQRAVYIGRLKESHKDDWEAILAEAQQGADAKMKAYSHLDPLPEKITEVSADVKSKLLAGALKTMAKKLVMREYGLNETTWLKPEKANHKPLQVEIDKKFSDLKAEFGLELWLDTPKEDQRSEAETTNTQVLSGGATSSSSSAL